MKENVYTYHSIFVQIIRGLQFSFEKLVNCIELIYNPGQSNFW